MLAFTYLSSVTDGSWGNYTLITPRNSKLKPYLISRSEVTVREYLEYCSQAGAAYPSKLDSTCPDCAITNVTHKEADAYCKWVGGRLPTEDEWLYAAEAEEKYDYSGSNTAGDVAIYGKGYTKPGKTGHKKPNRFGIYDMSGNAAEWCESNITTGSDSIKIVRGGSYISTVNTLKITNREKCHADSVKPYIGFRVVRDFPPKP